MKAIVVAALVLSVASALIATPDLEAGNYAKLFSAFKTEYNKNYKDSNEESRRFGYFVANMKKAAAVQKKNPLATFGPNRFSDLSEGEFRKYVNNGDGLRMLQRRLALGKKAAVPVRGKCSKVDWRKKGGVSPVQDMGECSGAGFAFATVGNIESQWVVAGHNLTALSAQQAVSCDGSSLGCDGSQSYAFQYFLTQRAGRVVTDSALPFKNAKYGSALPCPDLDKLTNGAVITDFVTLPADEDAMGDWMCDNGAIAVGVDGDDWKSYTGGIITDCDSQRITLATLIVGFDDTHNPPYWIVKNAWGTKWGEQGYLRLKKGTNECLIAMMPMTAVASKGPAPPPGPVPSVVRMFCTDSECSQDCFNMSYPLGDCQPDVITGGSTRDECNAEKVILFKYNTTVCSGKFTTRIFPTKQCQKLKNGGYWMHFCVGK